MLYLDVFKSNSVGRHRWVEYGDKGRYNASQVPPEWHGWLHFVTDHTGDEVSLLLHKLHVTFYVVNSQTKSKTSYVVK